MLDKMHTLQLLVKCSRVPMSVNTDDQDFYLSPHHLLVLHSVTKNSFEITKVIHKAYNEPL